MLKKKVLKINFTNSSESLEIEDVKELMYTGIRKVSGGFEVESFYLETIGELLDAPIISIEEEGKVFFVSTPQKREKTKSGVKIYSV